MSVANEPRATCYILTEDLKLTKLQEKIFQEIKDDWPELTENDLAFLIRQISFRTKVACGKAITARPHHSHDDFIRTIQEI
jgi:hypothetical protein